jgi:hypothetical protein
MVPTKAVPEPIVAPPALVTQKTLQESAPSLRTILPPVVESAPAMASGAWKIQIPVVTPAPFRVRTPPDRVKAVDAEV